MANIATLRARDRTYIAFVDDEPSRSLIQIKDVLSPSIIFSESDWNVGGVNTPDATDSTIEGPKHDNDYHTRRIRYRVGVFAVRRNARMG
jgi:hypothetical protein